MFAVEEGVVELYTVVSGIEKLFMTVRPGGVFGLLSLIDSGDQAGSARAVEKTRAVAIRRESLDRLVETHPGIGAKLLSGIGTTLGRQIRTLVDQYRDTVAWNLEVTGLASLNLERIMTERIQVAVETLRGEPLTGTLLRFETSSSTARPHSYVRLVTDVEPGKCRGSVPDLARNFLVNREGVGQKVRASRRSATLASRFLR